LATHDHHHADSRWMVLPASIFPLCHRRSTKLKLQQQHMA
jgi:hypothetical protein